MRKLLYTTAETKAVGGFGTTRLYQLINEGVLKAVRLGHRTYVTADSLEAFIASLPPVVTPTMARTEHDRRLRARAKPKEGEPGAVE